MYLNIAKWLGTILGVHLNYVWVGPRNFVYHFIFLIRLGRTERDCFFFRRERERAHKVLATINSTFAFLGAVIIAFTLFSLITACSLMAFHLKTHQYSYDPLNLG